MKNILEMRIGVTPYSGRTDGGEFLIEWYPLLGFKKEFKNPIPLEGVYMRKAIERIKQTYPECALGQDSSDLRLWATSLTPEQATEIHNAIETAYWTELALRTK